MKSKHRKEKASLGGAKSGVNLERKESAAAMSLKEISKG